MDDVFAAGDRFLLSQARLLERRLFATCFLGASANRVLDVLRGYQNEDGGFGHGIEPDTSCPASLPIYVETAFQVLATIATVDRSRVLRACDFLARSAVQADAGGAVPLAFPIIESFPRGEHWTEWAYEPGLNPTAVWWGCSTSSASSIPGGRTRPGTAGNGSNPARCPTAHTRFPKCWSSSGTFPSATVQTTVQRKLHVIWRRSPVSISTPKRRAMGYHPFTSHQLQPRDGASSSPMSRSALPSSTCCASKSPTADGQSVGKPLARLPPWSGGESSRF